jgi:succinyl-diaminopimelate desuccinylase
VTAADDLTDPLPLAQALLRCPSVTPEDGGAQAVLGAALDRLGFTLHPLRFGATENLYARRGTAGPHFCFAGHTDVVPPGEGWRHDPFGGVVEDGILYGRGACDMKGGIAAFVAGAARAIQAGTAPASVSLLITGDEEGEATDGTTRVLDWMRDQGEIPDFCLVGEPTNPERLGEIIKIGRRGSLSATIRVFGVQGHVAYPQRADNPVHRLLAILTALTTRRLDEGNRWFEPSSLQVTSIDVGNRAGNVIPAEAVAQLNIRFNDAHDGAALEGWIRETAAAHAPRVEVTTHLSGNSFLTKPGDQVAALAQAIERSFGTAPRLDTGGGTSDARFITTLCPVAEFGLVGATMHKVDEQVPVADLRALAGAYQGVLESFAR